VHAEPPRPQQTLLQGLGGAASGAQRLAPEHRAPATDSQPHPPATMQRRGSEMAPPPQQGGDQLWSGRWRPQTGLEPSHSEQSLVESLSFVLHSDPARSGGARTPEGGRHGNAQTSEGASRRPSRALI